MEKIVCPGLSKIFMFRHFVAFALTPVDVSKVISPEFKKINSQVVLLRVERNDEKCPILNRLIKHILPFIMLLLTEWYYCTYNKSWRYCEAVSKMSFGNKIGIKFSNEMTVDELFCPDIGSLVLEIKEEKTSMICSEVFLSGL